MAAADIKAPPDDGSSGGAPGRTKWSKRRAEAFLKSCPKRTIFVQRTADEEAHELRTGEPVYRWVGWNGWSWTVPAGRSVEVPEPIALILEQSQQLLRTTQARERRTVMAPLNDGDLGVKVEM